MARHSAINLHVFIVGLVLVLKVYGTVSERERLLLDTTVWLGIAGLIPVLDHSLQGLRAGDRESLKLAVAA